MSFAASYDYLTAHIAAAGGSQSANFAVGQHVEWGVSFIRGSRLTMSAGAGQAAGIFTLQGPGQYNLTWNLQAVWNPQALGGMSLVLHNLTTGANALTIDGSDLFSVHIASTFAPAAGTTQVPSAQGVIAIAAATTTSFDIRVAAVDTNPSVGYAGYSSLMIEAVDRPG